MKRISNRLILVSLSACLWACAASATDAPATGPVPAPTTSVTPPSVAPMLPVATPAPGNSNLSKIKLPPNPRIMVVPINDRESTKAGYIDSWQAAWVKRRLDEAKREKYDLVILEINTFGGEVQACMDIEQAIASCGIPVIGYVKEKAISGGSLLAVGCRAVVMEPATEIGDALPISSKGDLNHDSRLKAQDMLQKWMRARCEANGLPAPLAEGMVNSDIEVYETDNAQARFIISTALDDWKLHPGARGPAPTILKTWKVKDSVLSLTASEAYATGFSAATVGSIDALIALLGVKPTVINVASVTGAETASRFLSNIYISIALVLIGLVALVWELKSPGHGVGYGIFAFCLGLFFWQALAADRAGLAELIMFGLGALLLGLELFVITGFGFAGVAGIVLLLGSIGLSFLPEGTFPAIFKGTENPFKEAQINSALNWMALTLLAAIGIVGSSLVLGVRFPGMSRMTLRSSVQPVFTGTSSIAAPTPAPLPPPEGAAKPGGLPLHLLGKIGAAETTLRPAGKVRLDGQTFDAMTEGGMLDAGTPVKVLEVRATGLLVRSTNP